MNLHSKPGCQPLLSGCISARPPSRCVCPRRRAQVVRPALHADGSFQGAARSFTPPPPTLSQFQSATTENSVRQLQFEGYFCTSLIQHGEPTVTSCCYYQQGHEVWKRSKSCYNPFTKRRPVLTGFPSLLMLLQLFAFFFTCGVALFLLHKRSNFFLIKTRGFSLSFYLTCQ